jgi:hypothetical protein
MLTEKETKLGDRSPANTSDRVDHRPHQIKRVKVAPQQRCLWRAMTLLRTLVPRYRFANANATLSVSLGVSSLD